MMLQIKKTKEWLILGGLLLAVSLMLWWQAFLPVWRDHLQVDVVTFYNRSHSFWLNGSFAKIGLNEHQPGTLLFFLLPGFFNTGWQDFLTYETIFIFINILLIWLHFWFYASQRPFLTNLGFIMMMFFAGPILLFRFELIVSLLCLLSFFCWQKGRQKLALFLLGLATTAKIYPLLFVPYYLILVLKERKINTKLKTMFNLVEFFIIGVFLPILLTFFWGLSPKQMLTALMFHASKPVGIEGILAMIITFLNKFVRGTYPVYYGAWGVNGLPISNCYFSLSFYNYLWIPPLLFFYYFLWKKTSNSKVDYTVPFLITLLFLIFSKGINPQYIFWFLLFFPMVKIDKVIEKYLVQLFLVLVVILLTQYVYPLNYTQFLQNFYTRGQQVGIFYLNSLRNLLLIALFIGLFKKTFYPKTHENR